MGASHLGSLEKEEWNLVFKMYETRQGSRAKVGKHVLVKDGGRVILYGLKPEPEFNCWCAVNHNTIFRSLTGLPFRASH